MTFTIALFPKHDRDAHCRFCKRVVVKGLGKKTTLISLGKKTTSLGLDDRCLVMFRKTWLLSD